MVEKKGENKILYYLPTYIRLKVKEINSISIDDLQGEISATFLFSFYYGQL
jgi:hypothetical protein